MSDGLFTGTGYAKPYDPLGLPGGTNPMMARLLQLLLPQLQAGLGGGNTPMQVFGRQNPYEFGQAAQYYQTGQAAIAGARDAEAARYEAIVRGTANIFGGDPNKYAVIGRDAGNFFAPLLANMNPLLASRLLGSGGSPMVATQHFQTAGRHMLDPVTGQTGLSADTLSLLSSDLATSMQASDSMAMQNMPVDRMAETLAVATRRGYGPVGTRASLGQRDIDNITQMVQTGRVDAQSVESAGKLRSGELDIFDDNAADPDKALRKIEASRIGDWAEKWQGVVQALEDVFGPGQSVDELMTAMETITQHNAGGLDTEKLKMQIRTMHEYGKATGIGMEGMLQLSAAAAQFGDKLGLGRETAPIAAMHAAAFSKAFDMRGFGDTPKMDKERYTANAVQLQQQAAASGITALYGAAERVARFSDVGNDPASRAFRDSEAGKMVEAIRNGQLTYMFNGDEKQLPQDAAEWMGIMQRSGVSDADATAVMANTRENLKVAQRAGYEQLTRRGQWSRELSVVTGQAGQASIAATLAKMGMDAEQTLAATEHLTGAIMRVGDVSTLADSGKANAYFAQEFSAWAAGAGIAVTTQQAAAVGDIYRSQADTFLTGQGYKAGMADAYALHSPQSLADQRRAAMRVEGDAELADALGGIIQADPLRRFADALANATPETTREELLATLFGGAPADDLTKALQPVLDKIITVQQEKQALWANSANQDSATLGYNQVTLDELAVRKQKTATLINDAKAIKAAHDAKKAEAAAKKAAAREATIDEMKAKDTEELLEDMGLPTGDFTTLGRDAQYAAVDTLWEQLDKFSVEELLALQEAHPELGALVQDVGEMYATATPDVQRRMGEKADIARYRKLQELQAAQATQAAADAAQPAVTDTTSAGTTQPFLGTSVSNGQVLLASSGQASQMPANINITGTLTIPGLGEAKIQARSGGVGLPA